MSASIDAGRSVREVRSDSTERPFLVIWEATRACALACVHCRAEAIPNRNPAELSTVDARELMVQIYEMGSPPPIFVITGGDPFERPDLIELIEFGKSIGLSVAVSPSATKGLNADSLRAIQAAGVSALSLSLDGPTAEIHDRFRGIPGTFDRTITAWRLARDLGLKVQINTTVTRDNMRTLPDVVAHVAEIGAMTWSAFMLVPTGRGVDLNTPTAAEVEDVFNFLYDMGEIVPARTTEGHHFRRVVYQRDALRDAGIDHVDALKLGPLYQELRDRASALGLTGQTRRRRAPLNVSSANGFVFIDHIGLVYPSGFLPVSAGSIRTQRLSQIYRESEVFRDIRDHHRLHGRCGSCEFAAICGGSRSRAYAVTGDLFGDDPFCSYVPGSFNLDALAGR